MSRCVSVADPLVGKVAARGRSVTSTGCGAHGTKVGGRRRDRCQWPYTHGSIDLVGLKFVER